MKGLAEKREHRDQPGFFQFRRKRQLKLSRLLHEQFTRRLEERHSKLSPILEQHNRKNVVLVMMVNRGFMEMFLNWVASCDFHGIDPRPWSVVFALDAESGRQVEELGFAVHVETGSYGEQPSEAVRKFGDDDFARLMFAKTAVVQDVLLLDFDVLFQDVDVVWKKDPFEHLLQAAESGCDAQFMFDGPNAFHGPVHANSGFFFLRNNEQSRVFWGQVLENYSRILAYRSQQKVVNEVLVSRSHEGLNFSILTEQDYANGHLFCEDKPLQLPEDPFVVHCSWTRNIQQKIEKYKNAGLWFL